MSRARRATARTIGVMSLAAAWLCISAGLARGAEVAPVKEILDLAPANPTLLVVVPSMGRMSRHLSATNATMGLGLVQLDDSLARFKQALGIAKGVNDEGALLVAALPEAEGGGRFLALMPVLDFSAFVQSFGADGKQAVAELKMADGMVGWARKVEGYAVLGPSRAAVEGYRPGGAGAALLAAAGPQSVWQIGSSDFSIYVDATTAATLQPYAQFVLDWVRRSMKASMASSREGSISHIWTKSLHDLGGNLVRAAVRDCQAIVVSGDTDERSLSLSVSMQFKPGSESAAAFVGQGESAPMALRLPTDQFLVAAAAHVPSSGLVALTEQAAAVAAANKSPVLAALMTKSVPLLKKARYIADLASPTQGGGSESLYLAATVIETSDAAGTVKAFREMIAALPGADAPDPKVDQGMGTIANYAPQSMRIDEIEVDSWEVRFNFTQQMMADIGPNVGPLALLLSAGGRHGYVAVIDSYVVITTNPDPPFFKKIVAALKQEAGLGATALIAEVREEQVPKPSAEVFLGFHNINTAFNQFLRMTARKDLPIMEEAPPATIAWHGANGGITARALLPMPVAKRIHQHGPDMLAPFLPWELIPGAKPPPAATPAR